MGPYPKPKEQLAAAGILEYNPRLLAMGVKDPIVKKFLSRSRRATAHLRSIYLFGSRARGTGRPDSDYDFLLVVDEKFSLSEKDRLYDIVMDILLQTGRLVSLKIFKEKMFHKLCAMGTPFMTNVLREGIKVG